jgi:hypothetical protein
MNDKESSPKYRRVYAKIIKRPSKEVLSAKRMKWNAQHEFARETM